MPPSTLITSFALTVGVLAAALAAAIAFGGPTTPAQMASINVPEARMVVIKPYEASQLKPIEDAIRHSDLGVNPTNDGSIIRISIPQLTEERRRDLVKQAMADQASLIRPATDTAAQAPSIKAEDRLKSTVRDQRISSEPIRFKARDGQAFGSSLPNAAPA